MDKMFQKLHVTVQMAYPQKSNQNVVQSNDSKRQISQRNSWGLSGKK